MHGTRSSLALHAALGLVALAALSTPLPAAAMPILSEIFYDAVGSDDGQSFVELFGCAGASLDGLLLEVVNGSNGAVVTQIVLSGAIGSDGLFVVADVDGSGATAVPNADLLLNFDIQNGPDSVLLRDDVGVLDAVGFGSFGPDEFFAGEGTPAPDPPAGWSIARRFANVDSGDNAADFVALELPTPGTAPQAVPEAGSALLCALGLTGLAYRGRRPEPRT
jgi:hypothetical protein